MDQFQNNLETFLNQIGRAQSAKIVSRERLTAGAIQENWLLSVKFEGGPFNGFQEIVLRSNSFASISNSRSRAQEYALLRFAHKGGVQVPKPISLCTDMSVIGKPFFLMQRIEGIADARFVTRANRTDAERTQLLAQLGTELAAIHCLRPSKYELPFLEKTKATAAMGVIQRCREALDILPLAVPALEWGLRWAERNLPRSTRKVLCHRDFRTGNLMIDGNRLTGVLDWEFADWGDPMEDIGWFCAMCWRFGFTTREAGGIGRREDFYESYTVSGGQPINEDAVRFWEVIAHIRWAIIAREQGERFATYGERALEPAMTAFISPQLEWEILKMTSLSE